MSYASVYDNIPCKNCGHGKATHRDQGTLNGGKYRCAHRNDGSMPRFVWVPANADPTDCDRFRNGHYQFDCDCTAYSPSRQPTTEESFLADLI